MSELFRENPRSSAKPISLAGESIHFETRRQCKNGSMVDIELHDVPIQYRGEPHLLTIARDVTERKLAEHALRG